MSCGGSTHDNANAAAISESVKNVNAVVRPPAGDMDWSRMLREREQAGLIDDQTDAYRQAFLAYENAEENYRQHHGITGDLTEEQEAEVRSWAEMMAEAPAGHWAAAQDTVTNDTAHPDNFTDTPQAVADRATAVNTIIGIARRLGYTPSMSTDYSGKDMNGRQCTGITFDNEADVDEFHDALREYDADLAERMSRDVQFDLLGRGIRAYYPNVNLGEPGHGVDDYHSVY